MSLWFVQSRRVESRRFLLLFLSQANYSVLDPFHAKFVCGALRMKAVKNDLPDLI